MCSWLPTVMAVRLAKGRRGLDKPVAQVVLSIFFSRAVGARLARRAGFLMPLLYTQIRDHTIWGKCRMVTDVQSMEG